MGMAFSINEIPDVLAQDSYEEFTLEEITVTAQKREENLQKVAINMETISGDELTEMGRTNLSDVLSSVSGALVQKVGHELSVNIRGVVNNANPGDSVSPVGVSIDGSYSNNFGVGTSGFYDMQRVEVLSGPQGTLYSRNSAGGIVNMISNNPSTDKAEGSGSIEMGNYDLLNMQAMLNIPLNEKLAFRAAFNTTSHDGYISNGTGDDDTKSARLKLGYTASENLSAILTYEFTKSGGMGTGAGVDPFEDEDDVDNPWTSSYASNLFKNNRKSHRLYLNLEWSTPVGDVTFLPSYSKFFDNNTQQNGVSVGDDGLPSSGGPPGTTTAIGYEPEINSSTQKETSIELRMASPEDFFMKWLVGLYYYNQKWLKKNSKDTFYIEYEGNILEYSSSSEWSLRKNPSKSFFGNITYPVTDAFRVTGGARYTSDEETDTGYDSTGGMTGSDFYSDPTTYKSSNTDYKVGAEYDLGTNMMLWADYSTGYKRGFQGNPAQKLKSYQFGEKGRFFDERLQVNATAYLYDYENFQIQMSDEITVNDTTYSAQGWGEADIYGLDLSTNFIISMKDRINLSVSYLHASIANATVNYQSMTGEIYSTTTQTSGLPPLNNSPKYTITASYQHIFTLSNGGSLLARIDPRYKTDYTLVFQPSDLEGYDMDKLNTEPAHIMLDASLNYSAASGSWSINAYVKNAMNHAEKTGFYMTIDNMQISDPRTYGAVLSVKF